jgi:DNA-binding NtrC family response regulator
LKRSIHRHLTQPLATLVIEGKIEPASTVRVEINDERDGLRFDLASSAQAASRPTIVIVDDNRDFLKLLSLEIGAATGWRIVLAQSAAEAVSMQSQEPADFALLDLILPDGNGIELGAKLHEQQPPLRVVIMTGGDLTLEEERECEACGFATIKKPFLPQEVIGLLRQLAFRTARVSA